MAQGFQSGWQTNWLGSRLAWQRQPLLPAEIGEGLCKVMLARQNLLEDANFAKIACNHYVVDVSRENYRQRYQPLAAGLLQQWRDQLQAALLTANSRLGRQEYRFGGPLTIELQASPDVADSQARVLCRVDPNLPSGKAAVPAEYGQGRPEVAYLEWVDGHGRWPLHAGDNVIGRNPSCDVYLDLPVLHEKPLVSGQHATIRAEAGHCFLFDGRPGGKPSANGTYLNARRLPPQGALLHDGDVILLAALNPDQPRPDTPGVAALRFRQPPPAARP